ncbi:MAG: matrixin family metalloprotease [Planctomycetales bacterium]|nr:matrixin family metalloprotease [Planctomycetales bacterium]
MPKRGTRRSLLMEFLEGRRLLTASVGWDGPGQGTAELTYYLGPTGGAMPQATFESAIETALQAWESVANVHFVQTNQPGLKDSLDLTFRRLDGAGGTLAQAYFPDDVNWSSIAGDIQFDSADTWEVGNARGNAAFDLVEVAVHEIGHALGLDHINVRGSVMQSYVSAMDSFVGLSNTDKQAILRLYAPADTATTSTPDSNSGSTNTSNPVTPTTGSPNTGSSNGSIPNQYFNYWMRWFGSWSHRGSSHSLQAAPNRHNLDRPSDVNSDGLTSPVDALIVINELNRPSGSTDGLISESNETHLCDVNDDGGITPQDALMVINNLNIPPEAESADGNDVGDDSAGTDDSSGADESGLGNTSSDDLLENPDGNSDASNTDGTESSADNSNADDEVVSHDCSNSGVGDDDDELAESDDDNPANTATANMNQRLATYALAVVNTEQVFSTFDTSQDGVLTSDEMPQRFWQGLVDRGVDANSDSQVSSEELLSAVGAARNDWFNSLDSNQDGSLDDTEFQQLCRIDFANADTNGDSQISTDEFFALLDSVSSQMPSLWTPGSHHSHHGHHGRGWELGETGTGYLASRTSKNLLGLENRFEALDSNADGSLASDELATTVWDLLNGQIVDSNEDGAISLDELKVASDASLASDFTSLDSDSDGVLTEAEVLSRAWRHLVAGDENSDNQISIDEFTSFVRENAPPREHQSGWHHEHEHNAHALPSVAQRTASPNSVLSQFLRGRRS